MSPICFAPRSDACVVAGKPLVSAAAVGTDGQLTVYNFGEDGADTRGEDVDPGWID